MKPLVVFPLDYPFSKFVRVQLPNKKGMELRFLPLEENHVSYVSNEEKALGAGTIIVLKKTGWKFLSKYSFSLNITATFECSKMISETLGMPEIKKPFMEENEEPTTTFPEKINRCPVLWWPVRQINHLLRWILK